MIIPLRNARSSGSGSRRPKWASTEEEFLRARSASEITMSEGPSPAAVVTTRMLVGSLSARIEHRTSTDRLLHPDGSGTQDGPTVPFVKSYLVTPSFP